MQGYCEGIAKSTPEIADDDRTSGTSEIRSRLVRAILFHSGDLKPCEGRDNLTFRRPSRTRLAHLQQHMPVVSREEVVADLPTCCTRATNTSIMAGAHGSPLLSRWASADPPDRLGVHRLRRRVAKSR